MIYQSISGSCVVNYGLGIKTSLCFAYFDFFSGTDMNKRKGVDDFIIRGMNG